MNEQLENIVWEVCFLLIQKVGVYAVLSFLPQQVTFLCKLSRKLLPTNQKYSYATKMKFKNKALAQWTEMDVRRQKTVCGIKILFDIVCDC